MKAVVYARLSASDDEDNLRQQVERGRRYAEERSWEVVAEYMEPKVSGFKELIRDRPRGRVMWDAAEAKEFDVVVVRHVDRLSRKYDSLMLRELVHVACYDQGIDTTRGDRLSLGIGAVLAQEESAIKSDRQRAYRQRAAAKGQVRVGGTRAYGFEKNGTTPRLSEQAVIRKSAEMVVQGASLRSLRRYWSDQGIVTSKGGVVRQNVIRSVLLRAERYGVPDEVARRVRAVLQDPRRYRNGEGANRRRYVLNGLVRCGECGGPMYGTRATRARTPYYRCSSPDGGCGVTSILAAKLEGHVWSEAEHRDAGPAGDNESREGSEREAELQSAVALEEARAANKRRDYAEDLIDARTLRESLGVIEGRITELRRGLADLARSRQGYGLARLAVLPDFDEERAYLSSLVERVEVAKTARNPRVPAGERVTITWRDGVREV